MPNLKLIMQSIAPLAALGLAMGIAAGNAQADSFGSGMTAFTIDFVGVGNPGNGNDNVTPAIGPELYFGGVDYAYRIGVYEISQEQIDKATAGGLAGVTGGVYSGAKPAASINWLEAAAFVNWLNTSTGHQAAYQLTGLTGLTPWSSSEAWQLGGENLYRHKDAYYFLPSEDEWYKAAYHRNDGVTSNYWSYATGSNTAPAQELTGGTTPGTAVYNSSLEVGFPLSPADVTLAGGLSPYMTMGQNGNIWEWTESAHDGLNDSGDETRAARGGHWSTSEGFLLSSYRSSGTLTAENNSTGFRVASVPEPSSAVLMLAGLGAFLLMRRRRS